MKSRGLVDSYTLSGCIVGFVGKHSAFREGSDRNNQNTNTEIQLVPQKYTQNHFVEQVVVPVPQIREGIAAAIQLVPTASWSRSWSKCHRSERESRQRLFLCLKTALKTASWSRSVVPVPQIREGIAPAIQLVPQEGTQDRFVEQTVVPVPQIREGIAAAIQLVPQEGTQDRFVEQTVVPVPQIREGESWQRLNLCLKRALKTASWLRPWSNCHRSERESRQRFNLCLKRALKAAAWKQTVVPVPQIREWIAAAIQVVPQEGAQDRFVEQTIAPVPQIREGIAAAIQLLPQDGTEDRFVEQTDARSRSWTSWCHRSENKSLP